MSLPGFDLIETFRFEPDQGFRHFDLHMQRLRRSAGQLGFEFNPAQIEKKLQPLTNAANALRIRLCLTHAGAISITTAPYIPHAPQTIWRLGIAKTQLLHSDPLLRHKTTQRGHYNAARAEFSTTQVDEVLLMNEKHELCEGTITTLFTDMGDGLLLTPPLECGLLDGVYRRHMLEQGKAKTAILTLSDLQKADKIFVGNSLRGLIAAQLIETGER